MLQSGGDFGAQYQFRHLSFQEGIFADALLVDESGEGLTSSWEQMRSAMENPFFENSFRIGAGELGRRVAQVFPEEVVLEPQGLKAASLLGVFESSPDQQGAVPSFTLKASKNGPEGAAEVAEALKVFNGSLNTLKLQSTRPLFL
eukprot:247717-Pyramimonas_sp.AAC.1